jgi:hypothetical protein
MKRISIKLLIPIFFVIVSPARTDGAAAAEDDFQQETRRVLEEWRRGLSVLEIDALIEKEIRNCRELDYNEFEMRRRLYYIKRDAAGLIAKKGEHPVHAFTRQKWAYPGVVLFQERYPLLEKPNRRVIVEKERGCFSCAIL